MKNDIVEKKVVGSISLNGGDEEVQFSGECRFAPFFKDNGFFGTVKVGAGTFDVVGWMIDGILHVDGQDRTVGSNERIEFDIPETSSGEFAGVDFKSRPIHCIVCN